MKDGQEKQEPTGGQAVYISIEMKKDTDQLFRLVPEADL